VSAFSEHVLGEGERLLIICKLRVLYCFEVGDVCDTHFVVRGYVTVMAGHVLFDNY
jgi:hypothetical protein